MDINEFVMANEQLIRMSFFFGILAVMAMWEILAPCRALTVSKAVRWVNNLGLDTWVKHVCAIVGGSTIWELLGAFQKFLGRLSENGLKIKASTIIDTF